MKIKTTRKRAGATTGAASFHFDFSHVSEIFDHIEKNAETATGTKQAYNKNLTNEDSDRARWMGGIKNLQEYKETIKTGFLPAAETLQTINTTTQGGAALVPDVSGEFYDVGAYLLGLPECMATFQPADEKRIEKIVIEAATSADEEGAKLMKKAAAVYNSVQALENAGTRCEIYVNIGAKNDNATYTIKLNVKRAEEPLVPTWHGLLFGHLATVRLLGYSLLSLYSPKTSIGKPHTQDPEEGAIVVNYQTDSPETIKNRILNQ